MSLKIRLARHGAKKRPFYRIVVAEDRAPRDGVAKRIAGLIGLRAQESGGQGYVERCQRVLGRQIGRSRDIRKGKIAEKGRGNLQESDRLRRQARRTVPAQLGEYRASSSMPQRAAITRTQ